MRRQEGVKKRSGEGFVSRRQLRRVSAENQVKADRGIADDTDPLLRRRGTVRRGTS
jgi:hypothetical protein